MGLKRHLTWSAALALCMMGATAAGCTAEASIGGAVETPPPPPPPPPPDQDGDGILDPDDKCPAEKEDGKPPAPNDGCPNLDEDGDGVPIPQDKCPDQPETQNGFEDDDGCPDEKPLVQVVGTEVKINQKIMFQKNKATIEPDSMKVVTAVADVLKKYPDIQLVEVSGHASKEGDAFYNRTLTQKRVDSVVKELIKAGVEKDRLMAQGYGFYCLIDPGESEEQMEKNRRVEFKILHRNGKETDAKRGCEAAEKAGIKLKALPKPKSMSDKPPTPEKPADKPAAEGKAPAGAKKTATPVAPK